MKGGLEDEADMLVLHRRHLIACGVPEDRAFATDTIPTTRTDLRQHYAAILLGAVDRPAWAGSLPLKSQGGS